MWTYIKLAYQKHQLLRFLIVGCMNTAVGFAIFSLLTMIGLHYTLTVLLALLGGILFNFISYGNLVFYNNDYRLLIKFFLVYIFLYCANTYLLSRLLAQNLNVYLAQGLVTVPLAICAYILTKGLIFRDATDKEA